MEHSPKDRNIARKLEEGQSLLKAFDCPIVFDTEKNEATMEYPGLMFDDYDINLLQPKPWKVLKIFEFAYLMGYEMPMAGSKQNLIDWNKLAAGRLRFLRLIQLTFAQNMYDPDISKSPLTINLSLKHVGKSSVINQQIMMDPKKDVLAKFTTHTVLVDPETLRPSPHPVWFIEKYANRSADPQSKPEKVSTVSRPETCLLCHVTVGCSDTDINQHTTMTAYVKFALDGMRCTPTDGQMNTLTARMKNGVKSIQGLFMQESVEGDVLTIYVWEDSDSRVIAHICKDDDQLVCQISFSFF